VFGATAFVAGTGILNPGTAMAKTVRLNFEPVAANTLDTITVPKGFQWRTIVSWGDPFDHQTRGTGASQELAFGDNNDGVALFARGGNGFSRSKMNM
jgi:secreted PhoX family phosphatase